MSDTVKKLDLRIVKSQKALKYSLIELIKIKPFDKITINEICEKAYVNRMTFYNHYQDKYDLFNQCLKDAQEDIKNDFIIRVQGINIKDNLTLCLTKLFELTLDQCISYKEILILITKGQDNSIIEFMIRDFIENTFKYCLDTFEFTKISNVPSSVMSSFLTWGTSGAIYYWLNHQDDCSKEQFLEFINDLLVSYLSKYY